MKNIIISLLIITTIFTSCGDNASSTSQPQIIDIKTYCVEETTIESIKTYITLEKDDLLVNDENDTKIEIYHDENDNKKVCLINGSAHILRY